MPPSPSFSVTTYLPRREPTATDVDDSTAESSFLERPPVKGEIAVLPSRAMKRILLSLTVLLAIPALAGPADKESAAHYDKGKRAFDEGDLPKAIDELKASVAAKPNSKAYLLLGNAYTKVGQLDDAKKAFEEMLKADPNSSKKKTVENLIRELDVLAKTKLVITSTPPGATVFL